MRLIVRATVLVLIAAALLGTGARNAAAGSRLGQEAPQVPTVPDPVAVTLDRTTTAFLALDFLDSNCGPRPACVATLPAVNAALAAARTASIPVFYSVVGTGNILPDVMPATSDTVIKSFGADKFFNTDLDAMLKADGISTVVIAGTSSNGAVLYTGYAADARGYTVVVAEDGLSAATDFGTLFTEWELLNLPGPSNPQNTPLQAKAVTLSRTDLLTYK
jgi:nicotinamidase-related amidase